MTQAISSRLQYIYPANLFIRLLACILDLYIAIFFIASVLVGISVGFGIPLSRYADFLNVQGVDIERYGSPHMSLIWSFVLISYLPVIVTILLSATFEASSARASLGKSVLGIKVFDIAYPNVSFGQVLRRNVFKYLTWFLLATGILMSLYLVQVEPHLDYLMPKLFLYIVAVSFIYGIISVFIILSSDLHKGVHCKLTNTVVVRDIDSSQDTTIFFVLLTLILIFLNVMYLDNIYYAITNIRPRVNYEQSAVDEPLETAKPKAQVEKMIKQIEKQTKSAKEEIAVPERKFPSVSQKEAIKTLRRGETVDKMSR